MISAVIVCTAATAARPSTSLLGENEDWWTPTEPGSA